MKKEKEWELELQKLREKFVGKQIYINKCLIWLDENVPTKVIDCSINPVYLPLQDGVKIATGYGPSLIISKDGALWAIHPDCAELVLEPNIKYKVYTRDCSICNSPSRKCGNILLCSNLKCKSRVGYKKLVKQFNLLKNLNKGIDSSNPIDLLCSKCNLLYDMINQNDGVLYGRCTVHGSEEYKSKLIKELWYRYQPYGYDKNKKYLLKFIGEAMFGSCWSKESCWEE